MAMSVAELKEEVQDRGLDPTSFKKADLQKALKKSIFGNEDFGDDESKTGKKRKNGAKEEGNKKRKEDDKQEKEMQMKFLIDKLGAKLANLVIYLKNLFATDSSARVIVFSQDTNYLGRISTLLNNCGISNSFVLGSVAQRNKVFKEFKADNSAVKVIMLSMNKAASGSNLIECSHVILMEQAEGTKKQVLAVESQAIGRAYRQGQEKQVTVVRLIAKDTVEHELYLQNHVHIEEVTTLVRSSSSLLGDFVGDI